MGDYSFFETIVVGENPEELMDLYDKNKLVEPKLIYKFSDAEFIKAKYVEVYTSALLNDELSSKERRMMQDNLKEVIKMPADAFYFEITSEYEIDPKTNDAYSSENPNGKWGSYQRGRFFSVPFITLDGKEVFQARKSEINWPLMHKHNIEVYESAWDMVMEGKAPSNDDEKLIYDNMKNRTAYFEKFGNKECYVSHSTSFWAYAIVDKSGWKELEDDVDEFDWVSTFYERFIEPLDDNELLTIFECKK